MADEKPLLDLNDPKIREGFEKAVKAHPYMANAVISVHNAGTPLEFIMARSTTMRSGDSIQLYTNGHMYVSHQANKTLPYSSRLQDGTKGSINPSYGIRTDASFGSAQKSEIHSYVHHAPNLPELGEHPFLSKTPDPKRAAEYAAALEKRELAIKADPVLQKKMAEQKALATGVRDWADGLLGDRISAEKAAIAKQEREMNGISAGQKVDVSKSGAQIRDAVTCVGEELGAYVPFSTINVKGKGQDAAAVMSGQVSGTKVDVAISKDGSEVKMQTEASKATGNYTGAANADVAGKVQPGKGTDPAEQKYAEQFAATAAKCAKHLAPTK